MNLREIIQVLRVVSSATCRKKKYHISSVIRQKFFSFQNNPKNLNPSYKIDPDPLDCLGRVKLVL